MEWPFIEMDYAIILEILRYYFLVNDRKELLYLQISRKLASSFSA